MKDLVVKILLSMVYLFIDFVKGLMKTCILISLPFVYLYYIIHQTKTADKS